MIWLQALAIGVGTLGAALMSARAIVACVRAKDLGEAWLQKYLRLDLKKTMGPWHYLGTLLAVSLLAGLWVGLNALAQGALPLNPTQLPGLQPLHAWHLATSVATHTNWQPWPPETELTAWTKLMAVGPANLLMGAVGLAAWMALVRALARQPLGNAWGALFRSLMILVPLQLLLAAVLATQGVDLAVAGFSAGALVSGAGAGWDSLSWASPLVSPSGISDLAGVVALVGLPLGLGYATGQLIGRQRLLERWCLLALLVLAGWTALTLAYPIAPSAHRGQLAQALWLNATAGSSNGTLNTALEAYAPQGRLGACLMLLAGIPFPPAMGLGVALLIMYGLIAVYLGSLMVGRSPAFLGFRVDSTMVRMVAAGVLGPQLIMLLAAALLAGTPQVGQLLATGGAASASAVMWLMGSCAQNNGSAWGLPLADPLFIHSGVVLMIAGRLLTLAAVVLLAGAIARQGQSPPVAATVPEEGGWMMIFWLVVVLVGGALAVGALMAMGPILEVL